MNIAFCIIGSFAFADGSECQEYVVLAPCEYEDSTNCYWDAQTMGNLDGVSFVTVDSTTYTWKG